MFRAIFNYLPRFTLRRALTVLALLAIFLGWLRPDRAGVTNHSLYRGIHFRPMWPDCSIRFGRYTIMRRVEYKLEVAFPHDNLPI